MNIPIHYTHILFTESKVDVDKLTKRANAFVLGIEQTKKWSMDRVKKG
jgi:hypothetical protein